MAQNNSERGKHKNPSLTIVTVVVRISQAIFDGQLVPTNFFLVWFLCDFLLYGINLPVMHTGFVYHQRLVYGQIVCSIVK